MAATYEHTRFIPIRKWKRGALLRRGGMREVFIGKNVYTDQIFLVKSVPTSPARSRELLELQSEAKILKRLSKLHCPNIFRLLGTSTSHSVVHFGGRTTMDIFLEFAMPRGNIAEIVRQGEKLKESAAKTFTVQILQALAFMHKQGVVHGDVCGENVILCEKGVKLYGFSCAKDYCRRKESTTRILPSENGAASWWRDDAPPNPNPIGLPPGAEDDVRALGLTVCEMITGSRPAMDYFDDGADAEAPRASGDEVLRDLESDERLRDMLDCLGFIKCCLKEAPAKGVGGGAEWTAERLLNHPWVANFRSLSLPQQSSQHGDGSATSRGTPRGATNGALPPSGSPRLFTLSTGCKDLLCCQSLSVAPKFSPRDPDLSQSPTRANNGNKFKRHLTFSLSPRW